MKFNAILIIFCLAIAVSQAQETADIKELELLAHWAQTISNTLFNRTEHDRCEDYLNHIEFTSLEQTIFAEEQVSSLSPEELQLLFRILAQRMEIPFNNTNDGCFARAHYMSILMDRLGITSLKAFALVQDTDKYRLSVPNPRNPDQQVHWNYHVAPVIMMRNHNEGLIPMVLDPSLFDGPVPLSEWHDYMSLRNQNNARYLQRHESRQTRLRVGEEDLDWANTETFPLAITNRFTYKPDDITETPNEYQIEDLANAEFTLQHDNYTIRGLRSPVPFPPKNE